MEENNQPTNSTIQRDLEQIPPDRYIYSRANQLASLFVHEFTRHLSAATLKDLAVQVIRISVDKLRGWRPPSAMGLCKDYMDESNARRLVDKYPQIEEIVAESLKSGKYDNLWRLGELFSWAMI